MEHEIGDMRIVRARWEVKRGQARANRTTSGLSGGTTYTWAVITNHTSHFWGDTTSLELMEGLQLEWRRIRALLIAGVESGLLGLKVL